MHDGAVALVLVATVACIAGCAGNGATVEESQSSTGTDSAAQHQLAILAEREIEQPSSAAREGAREHLAQLAERFGIDASNGDTRLPLEDVLATAAERYRQSDTHDPPLPSSDADPDAAAELVARARASLAQDNNDAALDTLRLAAQRDPTNASTWRLLGLTANDAANRPLARAALRRAFDLGDRGPRALDTLAELAQEADLRSLAIAVFAERLAIERDSSRSNAQVHGDLARSLDRAGFVRAAAEARIAAADAATEEATEEAAGGAASREVALQRRLPRLLIDAGDRLAALGLLDRAEAAYTRAADVIEDAAGTRAGADAAIARRLARLDLGRGWPAHAAMHAVDAISQHRTPSADDAALVVELAQHAELQPILADEIEYLAATHDAQSAGRETLAWAILAAAAAPDPISRQRHLIEPFRDAPHDDALLLAIFDALASTAPERRDRTMAALAAKAPWRTEHVVRAALDRFGIDAFLTIKPNDTNDVAFATAAMHADRLRGDRPLNPRLTDDLAERFRPAQGPALLHARTLADVGRGRDADEYVEDRIRPDKDPGPGTLTTAAWFFFDREAFRLAISTATRVLEHPLAADDAPATAAAMLVRARANAAVGRTEASLADLAALLDRVPAHEDALALRFQLLEASNADPSVIAGAANDITARAAGSRTARWLDARRTLADGRVDEAARALRSLVETAAPPNRIAVDFTAASIEAGRAADAARFLASLARERVHRPLFTALRVRATAADNAPRAAIRAARAYLDDWPHDSAVLRAAEAVARSAASNAPEALTFANTRLENAPDSLATAAESARIHAQTGALTAAARAIADADERSERDDPTPLETRLLQQLAGVTAARLARRDDPAALDRVTDHDAVQASTILATVDRVTGDLPVAARIAQLSLAAITDDPPDPNRLIAIYLRLDAPNAGFADAATANAALQLILRAERIAEVEPQTIAADTPHAEAAFVLLDHATDAPPPLLLRSLALRLYAAVVYNRTGDILASVGIANNAGQLRELLLTAAREYGALAGDAEGDEGAANVAAIVAFRIPDDHFELVERLHRFTLSVRPDDPNALNSLGYRLIERNERIEEAARMLEIAHAAEPDSAAITDSLGWARYKQGILEDTPEKQGAISLLERSLELALSPDNADNPDAEPDGATAAIVADHLADALWRNGQREAAIDHWQRAADYAQKTLDGNGIAPGPAREEVAAVARNAASKRRDAEADRAPVVAPSPGLDDRGASRANE